MQHDQRYAEQLFARLKEWGNCAEQVKAQHRTLAQLAQYVEASKDVEEFLPPGIVRLYTGSRHFLPPFSPLRIHRGTSAWFSPR